MNKKTRKTLRLDRTTIRTLTADHMRKIAGGFRIGTFTSNRVIGCDPTLSKNDDCNDVTDDCPVLGSIVIC